MPGIVIAGTHSGCGKTTVALGIMAALRKKGLAVQPFKTGPDFIDAGLHGAVTGRPSRNLDLWMCGKDYVADCFKKHAAAADIAVIEGVMGMHDGEYSTARLARLLQAPVLLVVDAYGMAESAGAVVQGFVEYGVRSSEFGVKCEKNRFVGVIFNRVASENHYARLKESVRAVPVLGCLPRDLQFEIPHRHLGLTTAEESPLAGENVERLADTVRRHIDIDAIIRKDDSSGKEIYHRTETRDDKETRKCTLAVAYDKAFSFYYEDNLDLLRAAGAHIIRFSPLSDTAIPDGVDGVYLGGGYPELHAAALSKNSAMLKSFRTWADAGRPIYAECGGLMYLSQGIHDFEGNFFAMSGLFPFETRMTRKPRLGYREILLREDCILGGSGDRRRGHEFHYSEISDGRVRTSRSDRDGSPCGVRNENAAYSVCDAQGRSRGPEGYRYKNALASYVHVHFGSDPAVAEKIATFLREKK